MSAPLRILVFGKQGSGKGTLAATLCERFDVPHISTGDMLRAAAASGSEFGRQVAAIMDAGDLVSDEVMEGVVRERLAAPDAAAGFILDGYPRTPGQAEFLAGLLVPGDITVAIELQVADEVVRARIVNRRVCTSCGTIYAVGRDEAARTGVCAACGGPVVQRDDDSEAALDARLATYAGLTEPLLGYYSERGLLERIPADADPATVADAAAGVIEGHRT